MALVKRNSPSKGPEFWTYWITVLLIAGPWGLTHASGFSTPEIVELAPLGDLKIKVTNTTGRTLQGLQVNILDSELSRITKKTTYRFPGQFKSGTERWLVLKTKTQGRAWLGLMEKARLLDQSYARKLWMSS